MHDIRAIRDNPAAFDAAMARRGLGPVAADILAIDDARRATIRSVESLQAKMNAAARQV
ncbi:MAG: serine--tRNA ligase, partial [Paracoccaceae bacterium]